MKNEANEFFTLSNGTFTFSETPTKNHVDFYRNDGEPLGDLDCQEPFKFYQAYVIRKIMSGELTDEVEFKISYTKSVDDKCLRIIVSDNTKPKNSCAK